MEMPGNKQLAAVTEHAAKKLHASLFPERGPWEEQPIMLKVSTRRMVAEVFLALWDFDKEDIVEFFANDGETVLEMRDKVSKL